MENDRNIYVYGASGHAKVIIDILEANNSHDIEIWDDSVSGDIRIYPIKKPYTLATKGKMIVGVGNNYHRKQIVDLNKAGFDFVKAIHKNTVLSKNSNIGDGTVIMAGVIVNADAKIGEHCIINTSAIIEHDCILENYVHISPNATLCGNVFIGEGTHIGSSAVVIPRVKIGKWCTVGAGTVVIRDVPDFGVVVGNPGKLIKYDNIDHV